MEVMEVFLNLVSRALDRSRYNQFRMCDFHFIMYGLSPYAVKLSPYGCTHNSPSAAEQRPARMPASRSPVSGFHNAPTDSGREASF